MNDPQHLLTTASEAALAAGNLIEEMAAGGINARDKGFRDVVTEADIASQKCIVDYVIGRFPDHTILAEEDDDSLTKIDPDNVVWIIDPIDGTSNYARQLPIYCVSIAATYKGSVLAGAIFDPQRNELFAACQDGGATVNGQPLQLAATADLTDALILHEWSRGQASRTEMVGWVSALTQQARTVRALGSAALAICWVAAGRADGYFNQQLGAWDWAAASLILQEAGGSISDHHNQALIPGLKGTKVIASNRLIHEQLRSLLV